MFSRLSGFMAAALSTCWAGAAIAAWPPADDSPPEKAYETLLAEVRTIAVSDADPTRRGWAWRALRLADDPALKTLYPQGLADTSPLVRCEAVESLEWLVGDAGADGQAARTAVVKAFRDPVELVRFKADIVSRDASESVNWNGLGIGQDWRPNGYPYGSGAVLNKASRSDEGWGLWLAYALRCNDYEKQFALENLYGEYAEAPEAWKQKAIAIGLASPNVSTRIEALQALKPTLPDLLARWINDPDPDFRSQVVGWFGWQYAPDSSALLNLGLRDEANGVVRAAVRVARERAVEIEADRQAFQQRVAADEFGRVETAIMVLMRLDVQRLNGPERVAYIKSVREKFLAAAPGSLERRTYAGLLARFVVDHFGGDGGNNVGVAQRLERRSALLSPDLSIAQAARALEALPTAAADPDAYVRLVVARSVGFSIRPALEEGKLTDAQAAVAWRTLLPLLDDADQRVRQAVATRLRFIPESLLRTDEAFRAKAEAAALKLLDSPQHSLARAAGRFFMRHQWRDEATPVLLAELRDRPEFETSLTQTARNDVAVEVLQHAPDSVPSDLAAALLTDHTYQGSSQPPLPKAQEMALERLLQLDALDQYLVHVVDANLHFDRQLAERLAGSQKWDEADVDDVVTFLDGLAPERLEVARVLIDALAALPPELIRPRLESLAQGASPSRVRYAVVGHDKALSPAALAQTLASSDAVSSLLSVHALSRRAELPSFAESPAYVRALAAEAGRRPGPQ